MKKILMITSEAEPFAKTGGLADVIGSLPQALNEEGAHVSVVMPKYGRIPEKFSKDFEFVTDFKVNLGWREQPAAIYKYEYDGVTFYFVENEYYFGGDVIYHYFDKDIERFAFFTRAVLEAIPFLDEIPDILHCHDWQTGMIPLLLDYQYGKLPPYENIKTVFSIHNIQFQGIYSKEVVADFLEIPYEYMEQDKAGFFGQVNFLKAGIVFSNLVTTVSETYATEIKYPFFGENLDSLLKEKDYKLFGILNGINYKTNNPETDTAIYQNYNVDTYKEGKAKNKEELQKELGIEVNPDKPIIAMVTRLTNQKGLDLIGFSMNKILDEGAQFVVLGSGDEKYESMFEYYAEENPDKVSANIGFSDKLARKIYAGSDMFLMPSLFEPCGIGQMIAARYGSVPIVREVGGLKDTICSYNEFSKTENGFTFANYNADDMLYTIKRAIEFYKMHNEHWDNVVTNAMNSDFSWGSSAKKYMDLYNSITVDSVII